MATAPPRGTRVLVGHIRTLSARDHRAEAIAWSGDRILALGSEREVLDAAGPHAHIERVEGAVLPGFVDAHHHLSIAALHREAIDCRGASTLDDLAARLRAGAADLPEGTWIYAVGLDEMALRERRPPPIDLLDAALPDHPLCLVHYTCHHACTNTRGLDLARIGADTPDPPGGTIERRRGNPTGWLTEAAMGLVEAPARGALIARRGQQYLDRLEAYCLELAALGITALADPTVSPELEDLYREASRQTRLPLRVVMMPVGAEGYLAPPTDRLDGPTTGEGSARLCVGPMKLFFDGAPACAMCLSIWQALGTTLRTTARAFSNRSLDPLRQLASQKGRLEGGALHTGALYHNTDHARELVASVTARGFGVAIHAIGNAAVTQAIDVLAAAPSDAIRRIEHATFVNMGDVSRLANAGIALVTQPGFLSMAAYEGVVPIAGVHTLPIASLLQAGVQVASSSDTPVIAPDPLIGVRAAVRRTTPGGTAIDPQEAVDLTTALRLATRCAAAVLGLASGTLEVGRPADLIVMSPDPFEDLDAARVTRTIIAGETVFDGS